MTNSDFNTIFADTIADRDWVAERANCRLRAAFDVLAARITRDVQQFKELDKEHRGRGAISLEQPHGYYLSVLRNESGIPTINRPYALFDLKTDHIEVNLGSRGAFRIQPVWDPDSRAMKFQVGDGDRLLTASQLSERFLLRLFFPDLTNHDT